MADLDQTSDTVLTSLLNIIDQTNFLKKVLLTYKNKSNFKSEIKDPKYSLKNATSIFNQVLRGISHMFLSD